MLYRVTRRNTLFPALYAALTVILSAGLLLFLCQPGGAEKDMLLAEREEWALVRGASLPPGRTVTFTREQWLQGPLMLASPEHPLPPDYPAPDARAVRAMVGSYLPVQEGTALRADVTYALCAMQTEHSFVGQAVISQGVVSAAQQDDLRRAAYARYAAVYPLAEALEKAYAAVPGGNESEHQTGYTLDLVLTEPLAMKEKNPLLRNEAGRWFSEHMARYGFIQRQGVCENVHLRYVGLPHAAAMELLGLGLEDYLVFLHKEKKLTLLRDGQPYAFLLCVPAAEAVSFPLPDQAAFLISGDNTGWVIAAIAAQNRF